MDVKIVSNNILKVVNVEDVKLQLYLEMFKLLMKKMPSTLFPCYTSTQLRDKIKRMSLSILPSPKKNVIFPF